VRRLHRACHRAPNTRTIFQNPDDRDLFVSRGLAPLAQARMIRGSGVDPSLYRPAERPVEQPVIVVPARMLYDKGVAEVVEASRRLRSRGVAHELWLAGGADAHNPAAISEAKLRAWEAEPGVRWLGHCDDMVGLFRRARIACLPSHREGVPKALIEAASCALPIVSTDAPGCREIVHHEVNGLLVPPRDPAALADALQRLLADADLCRALGRRGREHVIAEFTVERVIAQTFDVYRELLGESLLAVNAAGPPRHSSIVGSGAAR
jgi:glycosyltransferase involved in cell wall biosynthesis